MIGLTAGRKADFPTNVFDIRADRAGTEIDIAAEDGVTDICLVWRLGARQQYRSLDFAVGANQAAGGKQHILPNVGTGPNLHALFENRGAHDHSPGFDRAAGGYRDSIAKQVHTGWQVDIDAPVGPRLEIPGEPFAQRSPHRFSRIQEIRM